MVRRLFDLVGATVGLVLAAPLIAIASAGIALTSRGPILFYARRAGIRGRPFMMYKLRTMRVDQAGPRSRVTAADDPRVYPWGRVLRAMKVDELPQLMNVLRGEMSIIGPRPEDPDLVLAHYAPSHWDTLKVRPGLSSPGSLYHDTHGGPCLEGHDPEAAYIERLLPIKLALDLVYVQHASLWYDLRIIARTLAIIVGKLAGRRTFTSPPELAEARQVMEPMRHHGAPSPHHQPTPERRRRPGQPAIQSGRSR